MERTDQELVRIEKANRIREMGMDPFGHRFDRTHSSEDVREQYSKYEHDELEKVDTYLVALKSNIESEDYEQAVENLDICVYILEHIDDKEAFLLKNIF